MIGQAIVAVVDLRIGPAAGTVVRSATGSMSGRVTAAVTRRTGVAFGWARRSAAGWMIDPATVAVARPRIGGAVAAARPSATGSVVGRATVVVIGMAVAARRSAIGSAIGRATATALQAADRNGDRALNRSSAIETPTGTAVAALIGTAIEPLSTDGEQGADRGGEQAAERGERVADLRPGDRAGTAGGPGDDPGRRLLRGRVAAGRHRAGPGGVGLRAAAPASPAAGSEECAAAAWPGVVDRHGARRRLGAARHARVRPAAELQGVARAGSARHRPRRVARSADVERGRAGQRLQRGRLRRSRLVHLRPRLRRHRRLQPRDLHGHVDGQPGAERREVRRRRRQLVALPHRRRRQGARPARQPHQPGRPRHVRRRVHHVDRPRAADPRRAA